jgi:uncharacterized protein YegL
MRRLPVYLLIDTSWSMQGDPIQSVQSGIQLLIDNLQGDPTALETAWLSLMTFDSNVNVICELTELAEFEAQALTCNGMTSMGAGITEVLNRISMEVKKQSASERGDYKPMIFIMTDGEPNDDWKGPADQLRRSGYSVVCCAAGPDANTGPLKQMTEMVVSLRDASPDEFTKFFRWVSASITQSSKSVTAGEDVMYAPIDDDDDSFMLVP